MPHKDPRDPYVLPQVPEDDPIFLDVRPGHVQIEGITATVDYEPVTDVSKHRAFLAQQRERDLAIRETYDDAETDLLHEQLIDSADAMRLAHLLDKAYPNTPVGERAEAAAVALRVFDPLWMQVSRYHAAEAICGALRNFLTLHLGCQVVPEKALREHANKLAGIARQEVFNTLTAKRATTVRTWAAARLSMLQFGEEVE
jgi:hypothetical protein